MEHSIAAAPALCAHHPVLVDAADVLYVAVIQQGLAQAHLTVDVQAAVEETDGELELEDESVAVVDHSAGLAEDSE